MIEIPFDMLVIATCEVGTVYYYHSDHLVNTTESHYFVVLAKSDSAFHVVYATSQIEKCKAFVRQRGLLPETLVEVTPTPENGLRKNSVFNCNYLYEETLHSLKRKHEQKPVLVRGRMDDATVQLLIKGVKASKIVPREMKMLFT